MKMTLSMQSTESGMSSFPAVMLRLSETNWIASRLCRRLPLHPPQVNQSHHEWLEHHLGLYLQLSNVDY